MNNDKDDKKYPQSLYNRPISTSTNPSNPNQLSELQVKLKQGYPGVEISTFTFLGNKGWSSIPKIVFEEIARSARINQIDLSIHAPENDFQLDVVGYTRKAEYNEGDNKLIGYELSSILEAASDMAKIYGKSIRVNIHAGDVELTDWDKNYEEKVKMDLINSLKEMSERYGSNFNPLNTRVGKIVEYLFRIGSIDYNKYQEIINDLKNHNYQKAIENLPSWVFAKREGIFAIDGQDSYKFVDKLDPDSIFFSMKFHRDRLVGVNKNLTVTDALMELNKNQIEKIFNEIENRIDNLYHLLHYARDVNLIHVNRRLLGYMDQVANAVKAYINSGYHELAKNTFLRSLDILKGEVESAGANLEFIRVIVEKQKEFFEERNRVKDLNNVPNDIKQTIERYNQILNDINNLRDKLRSIYESIENYRNEFINRYEEFKKNSNNSYKLFEIIDSFPYKIYTKDDNGKMINIREEILRQSIREKLYKVMEEVKDNNISLFYPAQEYAENLAVKSFEFGLRFWLERMKEEIKNNPENVSVVTDYLPEIVIEESYAGALATRPDIWIKLLEDLKVKAREVLESEINNMINDLKNKANSISGEEKKKYEEAINKLSDFKNKINNIVEEKIGATLDVGHIKMFMANGYDVNDILNWVEKIKPYIKHMHVHETQWGTDTHLPLGMGWDDVIKKELEKLEDIIKDKGVMIIHEPGGWYSAGFAERYGQIDYLNYLGRANIYGYLNAPYGSYELTFSPSSLYANPATFELLHYGEGIPERYESSSGFFAQQFGGIIGYRQKPTFTGLPLS